MDLDEKQRMFARSYGELFDFLYRYVRYRVPHAQEGEDVMADVLARAYQKLDQFDPALGSLRQWTTGLAKHGIQMYWRSRRATVSLEDVAESTPGLVSIPGIQAVEHRLEVERVVRGLPPEAKALLAMRYEDGMTCQEIAETIGKEPAAVRKYFSRLLEKLRLDADQTLYD